MKSNIIAITIAICSIALGAAMTPELWKVFKHPNSSQSISPIFLWLRGILFIILGIALLAKKDNDLLMMVFLSFWYVLCYGYILYTYYRIKHKNKQKEKI